MIRIVVGLLAVLLLSSGVAAAQTQGQVPQGSYLHSCWNARVKGDVLYATCYREDGGWQNAILRDVDNCAGDIGNDNGVLRCSQLRYGGPRYDEGQGYDQRQRCERLRDRQHDIRERLEQTPSWDQDRQERLRQRLDEVRDRYRDEGCFRSERRERCERLHARWQHLYQQIQDTPVWDFDRQQRLRHELDETREAYRRESCSRR